MTSSLGVVKSVVFGALIAIAGCCAACAPATARPPSATRRRAAVVTGIVLIIVTDGIFAVLCNVLGI